MISGPSFDAGYAQALKDMRVEMAPLKQALEAGWQLVPPEMTPRMQVKWQSAYKAHRKNPSRIDSCEAVAWRAALKVAPKEIENDTSLSS